MKLKNRISSTLVGPKTVLKTYGDADGGEELWIKPKKYSTVEKDEISAMQNVSAANVNKAAATKLYLKMEKLKEELGKEVRVENVLEEVSDEEIKSLVESQNIPVAETYRLIIRYGVAEHNLCDGEEAQNAVDDEFVDEILKAPDLAAEIVSIVEDFNRPLALMKSPESGT